MKKTFFISGGSGGIGSELTKHLSKAGHIIHLAVRNVEKTQKMFEEFKNIHIELRNLEDYEDMTEYFLQKSQEGIKFDFVFMLAGDLRRDSDEMFAGDTKEEKEQNSIIYHELVNVRTAETVVFGLKKAFGDLLKNTVLIGVSSWAAHFEVDNPYRIDEEGYVRAKARLSYLLGEWKLENFFKDVICEEPALIRSPMTERQFPELIADPNVSKLESSEYVVHLRNLIAA
ncbi:MAG: SDR family NAD(P)-dependent oxidoreductase [Candidatus Pacebacteria bacterium]|nr:SDR family NAD(P)-dependent oxidoreductase [Candidatus Paceibacterota bacterium]